jgi:hypothetical protein
MRRFVLLAATLAYLLSGSSAFAASGAADLGAAVDSVIKRIRLGQLGNFRTLWGPQDSNVIAAISAAPRDPQAPSLLGAIQTAQSTQTTTPFDLLGAITAAQNGNPALEVSCVTPFALGNTGAYLDTPVCAPTGTRDYVRNTLLKQSGWKLAASFNNTDIGSNPDGLGVLFLYTPSGLVRQVLVLLNATQ